VLYVNNIRNYYNILRWITANEERGIENEIVDKRLIEIASNDQAL
jgi:hypothetical protein